VTLNDLERRNDRYFALNESHLKANCMKLV